MDKTVAEYRELLKILKAFLHQDNYTRSADCNYIELKKLSDIHSISGIVGYVLRNGMDDWSQLLYRTCAETVQRTNRFKKLENILENEKIPYHLVKGIVIREYYPVPSLRTFGDIDIIIKPEYRKITDNLMRSLGYTCGINWEPSYSYKKYNEFYEFHTELLDSSPIEEIDLRDFFKDPWKYAVKKSGYRYELDPEYCFLYVLVHLAKHVSSQGAGLRMYLDIAVLANNDKLDWGRLCEIVKTAKLERFFQTVLSAIEKWFGVEVPIEYKRTSDDTLEKLFVFTMKGGTFGFNAYSRSIMMLRENNRGKVGVIIKRMFPSVVSMADRYDYLKERPWLLPIAWVHRLVINRHRIKKEQELLKDIMAEDVEVVMQLKSMYREIGL